MKTRLVASVCAAILIPSVAFAEGDSYDSEMESLPVLTTDPAPRATVISTEPEYEVVEERWNASMFATGALVFAAAYGSSVIVAAASEDDLDDRGNSRLYVPIVGPWLALNDRGSSCPIERESCDGETTAKVLLIADGVFQGAGVLTMLTGLIQPTHHRVITRTADKKVRVTPTAVGMRGDPGISVFGRF